MASLEQNSSARAQSTEGDHFISCYPEHFKEMDFQKGSQFKGDNNCTCTYVEIETNPADDLSA